MISKMMERFIQLNIYQLYQSISFLTEYNEKWTVKYFKQCGRKLEKIRLLAQLCLLYEELSFQGFYSWEINEENIYIIDDIAHIQIQDYSFNLQKDKDQLFQNFYLFAQSDLEFTNNLSQQEEEELLQINDFRNMSGYLLMKGENYQINGDCRYIKELNYLFDFNINFQKDKLVEGNSYILKCNPPKFMITRKIIPSQEEYLIIKTPNVDKYNEYDREQLLKGFDREVCLLQQLQNNEHTTQLYSYISIFDQRFILLKLYEGDLENVFEKISKSKKNFTIKQVYNLTEQLLKGLSELHNLDIIHRDLKPKNIFILNLNELDDLKCVIADFDTSKSFKQQDNIQQSSFYGTDKYIPPECQWLQGNNPYQFTNLIDVWTTGMIIYQIANQGIYPEYINPNKQNLEEYVKDFEQPKISETLINYGYSPQFIELIAKCLLTNQSKRINSSSAYQFFIDLLKKEQQNVKKRIIKIVTKQGEQNPNQQKQEEQHKQQQQQPEENINPIKQQSQQQNYQQQKQVVQMTVSNDAIDSNKKPVLNRCATLLVGRKMQIISTTFVSK